MIHRLFALATLPLLAAPRVESTPLPQSTAAWHASKQSAEFRSENGVFLRRVGANERLAFRIPSLDLDMVFVNPGTFTLGDNDGEDDEAPETPAVISKGFWLGKYEVTQEEWRSIMNLRPSHYKGDLRPVEFISWTSANEFCQRLTQRERMAGRIPRGYVYRLPTEAEWEYACRVGQEGEPAGVTPETGWFAANAKEMTHPVGTKAPNRLGLFDMFGNVAEWCGDWFAKYPGHTVTDYDGPGSGDFRVARGGCAFDIAYGCRPAYRTGAEPAVRSAGIGMRLALAPEK
jgi:formylglycine-generating enzyme required for sulfatase activity